MPCRGTPTVRMKPTRRTRCTGATSRRITRGGSDGIGLWHLPRKFGLLRSPNPTRISLSRITLVGGSPHCRGRRMARGRHLFAALKGGVLGTTTVLVLCVSVMFPTPWYQEIVGILKQHPEVAVGIHLTLNSEWKNYRWGPVAGREAVPTLLDSNRFFFQSAEALHNNHPDIAQVEHELRAQIDRALHCGVKIDYVDYHMGTAVEYPEFRDVVERLAKEYSLGMMGYFGDSTDAPQYWAAPKSKGDSLVAFINRLHP